jgi:hypothetical protein
MYEDIQQRRAFLSVTLPQFRDAIPLLREVLSFDLEKRSGVTLLLAWDSAI